jgi:hypothetical protein
MLNKGTVQCTMYTSIHTCANSIQTSLQNTYIAGGGGTFWSGRFVHPITGNLIAVMYTKRSLILY